MKIFDISVEVSSDLPVWPTDRKPEIRQVMSIENGDAANVSEISMNIHSGTHIDAPFHYIRNGKPFPKVPLDVLIGEAHVFHLPGADCIDVKELESLSIPRSAERVLFRTRNSTLWDEGHTEFRPDYVALTPVAAAWIAARGVKLIGIDYLSIQRYADATPQTHITLLSAGVTILEGLNLSGISAGTYNLLCLPLRTATRDGAPARAVLVQE